MTCFRPLRFRLLSSRLLCVLLLSSLAAVASAASVSTSFYAISGAIGASSKGVSASSGSFSDNRVLLAARDDAASFVATDGAIRGVQLEAAFALLRAELAEANGASDLALAQAILAL